MHLSLSVKYTLKNRDPDYRGLTGEHIAYGKDKPATFDQLVGAVAYKVLGYYARFQDADTLNAALDKLRAALTHLHVSEHQAEDLPLFQEAPDA